MLGYIVMGGAAVVGALGWVAAPLLKPIEPSIGTRLVDPMAWRLRESADRLRTATWVGAAIVVMAIASAIWLDDDAPSSSRATPACDYACKVMRETHGHPFGGPHGEPTGQ